MAQKEQEREIRRCTGLKKTGNDRSDDDEPEFLLALLQSHTVAIMAAVVCRLASRTIKR